MPAGPDFFPQAHHYASPQPTFPLFTDNSQINAHFDDDKSSAAAPTAPAQVKVVAALSAADTYHAITEAGRDRGEMSALKTFLMGIYAGSYIAFGGCLCCYVLSNCPGEQVT